MLGLAVITSPANPLEIKPRSVRPKMGIRVRQEQGVSIKLPPIGLTLSVAFKSDSVTFLNFGRSKPACDVSVSTIGQVEMRPAKLNRSMCIGIFSEQRVDVRPAKLKIGMGIAIKSYTVVDLMPAKLVIRAIHESEVSYFAISPKKITIRFMDREDAVQLGKVTRV